MDQNEIPKPASEEIEEQLTAAFLQALETFQQSQLSKREQLTAFALMGLASRIQPIHLDKAEGTRRIAMVAVMLADQTIEELKK